MSLRFPRSDRGRLGEGRFCRCDTSQKPGMDDPNAHSRVGGSVGLELFHVDIIKDRLAVGVSGQESFYWDFKDHNVFWDPSVLGFVQGTLGSW